MFITVKLSDEKLRRLHGRGRLTLHVLSLSNKFLTLTKKRSEWVENTESTNCNDFRGTLVRFYDVNFAYKANNTLTHVQKTHVYKLAPCVPL